MATTTLAGSRIRERRQVTGLRQAELAQRVGISASYLNLIEHNRRRIGGKLLLDIARALEVEPASLSEGAEAALLAGLREAAAKRPEAQAEVARMDEFAGRFPGWARLLAAQQQRIAALENTVEGLTERLSHDPHLATAMHEMLTTVSAVRSTAAILADTPELEPEWQARFHRNLDEDSARLVDSAREIVTQLDEAEAPGEAPVSPQDEVEAFLAARSHHLPELEAGKPLAAVLVADTAPQEAEARAQLSERLMQYQSDAEQMPLERMASALAEIGFDPGALAADLTVPLPAMLRRLASLPAKLLPKPVGLVVADASGALIQRKEIDGFSMPRFSAACARWPLYAALSQPGLPLRRIVTMHGREAQSFECFAFAAPVSAPSFDEPPQLQASMLVRAVPEASEPGMDVGSTCRICPLIDCVARREASLLRAGI